MAMTVFKCDRKYFLNLSCVAVFVCVCVYVLDEGRCAGKDGPLRGVQSRGVRRACP